MNVQANVRSFRNEREYSIFIQEWRPRTGTPRGVIVLVHGLGEHSGRYQNVVERLLPEGYVLFGLDHQGFGRSEGERGHIERFDHYVDDVRRVVDEVRSNEPELPLILFGHSMGGLIGILYAQKYQETLDYLIISAPGLKAKTSPVLVYLMRFMNLIRPTFSLRRPGTGEFVSRDPAVVKAFVEDPLFVPVSSARWAVEILAAQPRAMARANRIQLPLLMLQGEADVVVNPEATYRFFDAVSSDDKTLLTYPGYFHELHNDIGKEKPLDDLTGWLNQKTS